MNTRLWAVTPGLASRGIPTTVESLPPNIDIETAKSLIKKHFGQGYSAIRIVGASTAQQALETVEHGPAFKPLPAFAKTVSEAASRLQHDNPALSEKIAESRWEAIYRKQKQGVRVHQKRERQFFEEKGAGGGIARHLRAFERRYGSSVDLNEMVDNLLSAAFDQMADRLNDRLRDEHKPRPVYIEPLDVYAIPMGGGES